MRRLLLLAAFALTGCQIQELVNPTPPAKCYMNLYAIRRVAVASGDSTWTVTDTTWLGTTEVACKAFP